VAGDGGAIPSIDDGIDPGLWTEQTRETASQLRQGQAVELPPFFYYASAEHPVHQITHEWAEVTERSSGVVDLTAEDLRPPYGLIATQTCDLAEEGKPKRPWVQLAPVYVYRCSAGEARKIQQGRSHPYLCWASGLGDRDDGLWVADLRILLPVEKGWLVEQTTLPGFADEPGYTDFANRLATRFARPAYATELVNEVLKPLRDLLAEVSDRFAGDDGIVEVGLELGRDRLDPQSARVCFIGNEPLRDEVRGFIGDWWTQTFGATGRGALQVLAPDFTDYDQLTARRYVGLDIMSISEFSPDD